MRYVAFKHEQFTNINKHTNTPLFDVELDRLDDACKLFWSHVTEPMLNAKFNINLCVKNMMEKGFDDYAAHTRIYEKYQIITYILIDYDFKFVDGLQRTFCEPHYEYWKTDVNKVIRELKIKTVLDD